MRELVVHERETEVEADESSVIGICDRSLHRAALCTTNTNMLLTLYLCVVPFVLLLVCSVADAHVSHQQGLIL